MNIKILDSWLREYLKTKATPQKIAEAMSLTSVSIERIEPYGKDFLYDIEITTNRADLMSVVGLAREAAAILPQFNIEASFVEPKLPKIDALKTDPLHITIENDKTLVRRICAVILEVKQKESPKFIQDRLESSDIRSLNNLIDVTNYVMRETGHPAHVFDYDRLTTKKLIIRESKKGETITTLDQKKHILPGGDIVADNGEGEIVDLLGIMGTANSVITPETTRILYFLDNNETSHIRRTSMSLAIRTEAATINEKGIDPELTYEALLRGIELYKALADAKILSDIIDIYPDKVNSKTVTVSHEKIEKLIGIPIPVKEVGNILSKLGFKNEVKNEIFKVIVPTSRINDVEIEEDIIEEVARIYGYHKLPNVLPPTTEIELEKSENKSFYWETKIKHALKYWGFTETYTYSMVSGDLFEGPLEDAVTIQNPLSEENVYMRKTLVPSLLQVVSEHQAREEVHIFELANIYEKRGENLPNERLSLAGVIKKQSLSFFEIKGIIEGILAELGIERYSFRERESGGLGADIFIEKELLGEIEMLEQDLGDFEINFEILLKYATTKRKYLSISKFPPAIEDIRIVIPEKSSYEQVVKLIKKLSYLVVDVSLFDMYKDKITLHITYHNPNDNITSEQVAIEREKILKGLHKELGIELA